MGNKPNREPTTYVNEAYSDHDVTGVQENANINQTLENILTPSLNSEQKRIKWSILKNVIGISMAFCLLFTSYNSLSNLQSSLHQKMGTISLGVIYAALISSCFFVPTLLIGRIGPKWGVCVSMFLYAPYFATLYFPRYYTFVPTAAILGAAGAPLWASKCTYLSKIAEKYSEVLGENYDIVIVRFFGIFFLFLQASQIFGNLISSSVLSVGVKNFSRSEEFLDRCGANFCPWFELNPEKEITTELKSLTNETSTMESVTDTAYQTKIYIMTSVYLFLALCAASLVAFLVDPISRYDLELQNQENSVKEKLLATVNQMKNPNQQLIIPLTIWSGLEQGLLSADYTAAYVSCGIGVHMVGYSLICFGAFDSIFSYAYTPIMKYTKRVPLFTFGAILNVAMSIVMFSWKPHPDDLAIFFLIPSVWGMADAVWQTQINALYGVIFPDSPEAAFSNYRLWESLGFLFAYIISSYLCMRAKLSICLVSLGIGMCGYYVIEFKERKSKTKNLD